MSINFKTSNAVGGAGCCFRGIPWGRRKQQPATGPTTISFEIDAHKEALTASRFEKFSFGFTMIEVLVAIAIMGVIMVAVQSTSKQLLDAKERNEERDLLLQSARVVLRKMGDDLRGAFLTKKISLAATPDGQPIELPTTRSVPKSITFFIGKDGGEQDQLQFTTFSHVRLYKNARESDQAKVAYRIEPYPDDNRYHNVTRVEVPWIDDTSDVEGRSVVLVEKVQELDIEYYDIRKEEWVKEWNTEQIDWRERLPSAVRIVLSFPDPDNEEESVTFTTGIFLPLSKEPIAF